jgi:DNA-binding response OmpR family regulator
MKLLLIEDDAHIAEFIKKGLEEESHIVDLAVDGEDGLDLAVTYEYDIIVLDVMLPKINGIDVCRKIRNKGIHTPIIMLTAKEAVKDKVKGLEAGADDYLTKPFSFDEFLARIRAISRRKRLDVMDLTLGDLRLDVISRRVFYGDTEIILRPKEYALLNYLLNNQGRVLSRTQILENVWGYQYDPSTNVVDVYIRNLREKLNPLFDSNIIRTVRGMGYMLEDS